MYYAIVFLPLLGAIIAALIALAGARARYPGGPPDVPSADAETAAEAAPDLPGPGEPVGFAAHIKPLFRERDRQSMSFAFDLWSYDDVRACAAGIARRVADGTMPCDGAWPAAWSEVFQRWIDTGQQP